MRISILKPLKSQPRERRIMAFDTEDDQRGYGPGTGFYLGCIVDEHGKAHTFTDRAKMVRFLARPKFGGAWVFAHNMEYDAQNLFGPGGVMALGPTFSGSRICGLRIHVGNGHKPNDYVYLVDTMSFLQASLAKLAPLVKMKKLDMKHRRGDRRVTAKRTTYCVRDTRIAWELAKFIQEGVLSLGAQMRLTAASTALDLFRRKYQRTAIPQMDEAMQVRLFGGYYGGRVECFRLGDYKRRIYSNDVNGMYSSVMIENPLPEIGMLRTGRRLELAEEGMTRCRITVPSDLWAGPLPVKGAKLMFPVGRLEGWWSHNELRRAVESGVRIDTVFDTYSTMKSYPFLREMNRSLRSLRETTDQPAVGQMAKLMGNSIYGKFAQRNEDFEFMERNKFIRRCLAKNIGPYDPQRTVEYPEYGMVKVVRGTTFPLHSNVIWAAYITAGARVKLYNHLDEGSTFYCDTDSVIGLKKYPKTKQIGAMAIKETYCRFVVRGNKLYAGELPSGTWDAHAKGVPRDQAKRAVLEPGVKIVSRRPVKFKTAIRGMGKANEWIEVYKRLTAEYDKRGVERDGTTRPLLVRMW